MIELEQDGDVFVLTMAAGENRWNTTFVREFDAALDQVAASTGPAALLTRSADAKFFSNGLDLAWAGYGEQPPGDRIVFGAEFMALAGRLITLEVPTVCAVNGHGFGAGFMIALCHDERHMRADRGYLCANEIELGMTIPDAELALFRHKLPAAAFHQSVLLARRWGGADALAAGVVQATASFDDLGNHALERARQLAPLAGNRDAVRAMKERLYGENAVLNSPHGAAWLLQHAAG